MTHSRALPVFLLIFAFCTLALQAEDQHPKNGISLDLGAGWCPYITYPSSMQKRLDSLASLSGVTKTDLCLNLDLGIPIWQSFQDQENANRAVYLSAGIDGYARRLEDWSGWLQVNNYVMGLGPQVKTGNTVSVVHVGPSFAVAQLSGSSSTTTARSETGIGIYARSDWTTTHDSGFGVSLGVMSQLAIIEDEFYSAFGIVLSLNSY